MFTIFETLKIWKVNPHTWLLNYFYECAMNGGTPLNNIEHYLPWKMSTETMAAFAASPEHQRPLEAG